MAMSRSLQRSLQWSTAIRARQADVGAVTRFTDFIPAARGLPHGLGIAPAMPESAPGPDGVPYEFQRVAPQPISGFLGDVAEGITNDVDPQLLDSFRLFIPKGLPCGHRPRHQGGARIEACSIDASICQDHRIRRVHSFRSWPRPPRPRSSGAS